MKTELTKIIENALLYYTGADGAGLYGAFEVCFGAAYGDEYCDFVTYKSTGEIRCYEIKVSKQDFHSKNKLTFKGHYNYYVMPAELYEEVKNEINYLHSTIGVLGFHKNEKYRHGGYFEVLRKPSKKTLYPYQQVEVMHCMVRSLSRLTTKYVKERENG